MRSTLLLSAFIIISISSCQKEPLSPSSLQLDLSHAGSGTNTSTGLKYGTMKDLDGNTYKTIQIGTQVWMAENLRVTKYRNGNPITNVTDATIWSTLTSGAWCYYNNDNTYDNPYGKLYNWYAISDARGLAPKGWHISTDADWNKMVKYLDPSADTTCLNCDQFTFSGNLLKESGTLHWLSPNSGATNSSGFTSIPGGARYENGLFNYIGYSANYWCSTSFNTTSAYFRNNVVGYQGVYRSNEGLKRYALTIRCVKD